MQDVGSQECGDPQGIQERERDPVQELAEKLKDGAAAILALVGNG